MSGWMVPAKRISLNTCTRTQFWSHFMGDVDVLGGCMQMLNKVSDHADVISVAFEGGLAGS
jgi:hypothetical protein